MNIIICDDEEFFFEKLKKELLMLPALQSADCSIQYCPNSESLLHTLSGSLSTDLLFMDINLGNEDGVEIIQNLRPGYPKLPVIFLTSLEDRIADGYDVSAFYFLFKSNFTQKLPSLMERFIAEYCQPKSIAIKDHGSVVFLAYSDIYYVEADKRNTCVHTLNTSHIENTSIQNFAKNLPADQFIEVYHALFVNVDHIRRVDNDFLELDNEMQLPVSRRKRKELMTTIMRRIHNR